MKNKYFTRLIQTCLLGLFIAATGNAQVFIKVTVLPPYSSHITDFASHPQQIMITVNNGGGNPVDMQLRGSMTGDNGIAIAVNKQYKSPSPIHLAPLETRNLSGTDINALFDYNQLVFTGITRDQLAARGNLPEGNYQICVQAFDYRNNTPLTEDECSNSFPISSAEPPIIIKPADGDNVMPVGNTQNFVITWTTPAGAPPSIQYTVKMVEILDNRSPENAIQTATQPAFFQQTITGTPALVYGPARPALTVGRRYALAVQAKDPTNTVVFRNNGLSEIIGFTYGDENAAPIIVPAEDNNVACSCKTPLPGNMQPANKNIAMGGIIKAGNFNITVLALVKNNDNSITGTGKVNLPVANASFIPVGVAFTNIQVNSNNELISGVIAAQVKADVNFLPTVPSPNPSLMPFTSNDVSNLSNYIDNNTTNVVSQLKNVAANTVFQLPIGIDKQVAGSPITVEITGLRITPTQATMDAATIINTPDDAVVSRIALGAKNVCVNTTDLCGDAKLFLAEDVELPSIGLTLKGAANPGGGTWVAFDKAGFKNMQIVGAIKLPQSLVVKKIDNASPVTAQVTATTEKGWADWMASVTIDPFVMAGNKDFGFTLAGSAMYDHSDIQNPPGMPAIDEKPEIKATQWHGFYMPQLTMDLPAALKNANGQPLQAAVQNLIIDGNGISAKVGAVNILQIGNGSLGGWYYSIDNLGITIINNSFKNGGLDGHIVLPVSGNDYNNTTNQLNYHCTLSPGNSGLKFQFALNIAGTQNINIPMWVAGINILNSSNITITAGGGDDFVAQATLNGNLSINTKIDPVGQINFKLMEVEGLTISNKYPYVSVTNFTAGMASPNKTLANLPITLDPPSLESKDGKVGIKFGMGIKLGTDNMVAPAASFKMFIAGKVGFDNGRPNWTYDNIYPEKIEVTTGNLGPISIGGELDFINDKKFGTGVAGTLTATFIDAFSCDAHVLFGKTDGAAGYPYFYVDAAATFNPGITLCTLPGPPISIFGFGGGVYFNLNRKTLTSDQAIDPNLAPSEKYDPQQGIVGFKAKILLGTNDGFTFLGSGQFEAAMDINRFALDQINIDLAAFYLCNATTWKPVAAVTGTGTLHFGFAQKVFSGNVSVNINYPPGDLAYITGQINGDFYFGTGKPWHIALGYPTKRNEIAYQVPGLKVKLQKFTSYFWVGTDGSGDLPAPEAPTEKLRTMLASISNTGSASAVSGEPTKDHPGIAFGASLQYGDEFSFGPVYAVLTLGGGFDLNLTKYTEPCDGVSGPPPGLDGWYAKGRLYLYFEGGGGVRCRILGHEITAPLVDIAAVASAQGGLPNPFYFSAGVNVSIDAAFGLISGSYAMQINFGSKCSNNAYSSPISIPIISDIQPAGGRPNDKSNASIWSHPEAAFNFAINQKIQLDVIEDDGSIKPHTFRINLDKFEVVAPNGGIFKSLASSTANFAGDHMSAFLYDPTRDKAFDPNTTYTINVHVTLTEIDKVTEAVIKTFGSGEAKTVTFITGPCVLDKQAILATFPLQNQRYFLSGDFHTGKIFFSEGLPDCLKTDDTYYTLYAEFIPYAGGQKGAPIDVPIVYSSSPETYSFSIPDLPVSAITELRIVKKINTAGILINNMSSIRALRVSLTFRGNVGSFKSYGNGLGSSFSQMPAEIEVMHYYFKTSMYKTLTAKINAMQTNTTGTLGKLGIQTTSYTGSYDAYERIDTYDADGFLKYEGGYQFWMAPLIMLTEEYTGHNPWYENYVKNQLYGTMFNLSNYAADYVHIPERTDLQLRDMGSFIPMGPLHFTAGSVDQPLTNTEIASVVNSIFRNGISQAATNMHIIP